MIGFILFFIAGLGFGYAAPGVWKWLPLAFPILLGLIAIMSDGLDGEIVLRLIIALVVTAVGVILGWMFEERRERRQPAAAS